MTRYLSRTCLAVALAGLLSGFAAYAEDAGSGFLSDYGKLQSDPKYPGSKSWVSPDAKSAGYVSIIVEPVVSHLSPALIEDGAKPDPQLLNETAAYLEDALKRDFAAAGWKVVDQPADHTLRYRAAITGIKADGGGVDSPVDMLPAVFVVRTVSGANQAQAHIYMESQYLDALTGEVVGEVIQGAEGDAVSGDSIALSNVQGVLDQWSAKAGEASMKALK